MEAKQEQARIGACLRMARQRAKVTQEEAAEAAGVHQSAISLWERGKSTPGLIQYKALLALYGTMGYQVLFGASPLEISAEERIELTRAARSFSPQLQRRVDVLLMTVLEPATSP